jgi:hypothetical protein
VGKGLGDRVYQHVKEKEYDWEDAVILDRNCEQWGDGDTIAFMNEGKYIKMYNPRDNKVSGHHKKEYYIMARFDGLFSVYQDGKRNMVEEMYEFVTNNSIVKNNLGPTTTRPSGTWEVETGAREGVYFGILVNVKSGISVRIKTKSDEKMSFFRGEMTDYEIIDEGTGAEATVTYAVDDLDIALELWTAFVRAK